jgi:hypothetical protein
MKPMQLALKRRNEIEHYWPENVFLPITEWFEALLIADFDPHQVAQMGELATTGPHRFTRSIYRFDPTLLESLMSTQLDGDLPTELLKRLPEWTVFIDIDEGVYVSLDYFKVGSRPFVIGNELAVPVEQQSEYELRIVTGDALAVVPLGPWSIDEAVSMVLNNARKHVDGYSVDLSGAAREMVEIAERYLPLIMYICSDGVEYSGNDRPEHHRPTPVRTRRDGWKLFPAKRDRIWTLGAETGERIRQGRTRTDTPGSRKRPAPHIRRAHWHTFRNGTVKFLPPIPVAQRETGV